MVRTALPIQQRLVLDPEVTPVSRRIVVAVMRGIEEGKLADGDPLPSSRRFAEGHGVSRSCVVEAYETLGGLGLVSSSQGSGTRISKGARELLQDRPVAAGMRSGKNRGSSPGRST